MQAVAHQNSVLVYAAQVNNNKQIDRYVDEEKTGSFLDSKKEVQVGTKVYAHSSAVNTI